MRLLARDTHARYSPSRDDDSHYARAHLLLPPCGGFGRRHQARSLHIPRVSAEEEVARRSILEPTGGSGLEDQRDPAHPEGFLALAPPPRHRGSDRPVEWQRDSTWFGLVCSMT